MTDQTPKDAEGEDQILEIGSIPLDRPRSPLHDQDWQDCQPLCPCGEPLPKSTTETTAPIQIASSSDIVSIADVPDARDNDAGGEVNHSLDVIKCYWGPADTESDAKQSLDKGAKENEKLDGDIVGPPKVIKCFWGVPIPEGYEFASNSGTSTPIAPEPSSYFAGEPRPERHPARRRPWWSDFQNPEQALETFVRAKETVEYFERIIADGNSLEAKQNLGYLKKSVQQGFAPRAKKALEKKYSTVFHDLAEDGERMAGESLDWMWLEARSTGASLSEDDVIRFFKLEALVE